MSDEEVIQAAKLAHCHEFISAFPDGYQTMVKARVGPMLGFKSFYNTRRVLIGIELMQKLVKSQYRVSTRERHLIDVWRAPLATR